MMGTEHREWPTLVCLQCCLCLALTNAHMLLFPTWIISYFRAFKLAMQVALSVIGVTSTDKSETITFPSLKPSVILAKSIM